MKLAFIVTRSSAKVVKDSFVHSILKTTRTLFYISGFYLVVVGKFVDDLRLAIRRRIIRDFAQKEKCSYANISNEAR